MRMIAVRCAARVEPQLHCGCGHAEPQGKDLQVRALAARGRKQTDGDHHVEVQQAVRQLVREDEALAAATGSRTIRRIF